MTPQDSTGLQINALPPARPTLTFTPTTSVSASTFTILDSAATVTADATTPVEAIRVSLSGTGTGVLGVVVNGVFDSDNIKSTIGKIDFAYDGTTKVLSLTDNTGNTAVGSDFQAVLQLVAYGGGAIGSTQGISINLGRAIYSSDNGHYYEFVKYDTAAAANTKEWIFANTAANGKNFLGLKGYLATVTTENENKFMNDRINERGWIGGSSAGTVAETAGGRVWKWVGGPEANTVFWNGNQDGTGVTGQYKNWAAGEPNNNSSGNENTKVGNTEPYAHFLADGTWNDYANNNTSLNGYWVEYSTQSGIGDDGLGGTRKAFNVTVADPSATDLVYYDPATGQVSFGFVGSNFNIISTADTPNLTYNPSPATSSAIGGTWKIISANVDVDGDGFKDLIFRNTTGSTEVLVTFGQTRDSTTRANAYTRFAKVEYAGNVLSVPSFTVDFASQKLGASNTPALLWRDAASGNVVVGNLLVTTTGGVSKVTHQFSNVFNIGAGSTWRAVGDGEFNADVTTRELIWTNDVTGNVITWSLNNNRSVLNSFSFLSYNGNIVNVGTLASGYKVVGVGNIDGAGNDEIVWQKGVSTIIWKMKDRLIDGSVSVLTLSSPDRIKAIAKVDADTTLDLVGQNDTDGSVGVYALSEAAGGFTLKGARSQYTLANAAYKPGKGTGGKNLELVNVAQYDIVA